MIHEWYVEEARSTGSPTTSSSCGRAASLEAWNNRGDSRQARTGFVNGSWDETSLADANEYVGAGLFINPNYGYAALACHAAWAHAGATAALLAANATAATRTSPR